MMKDFTEDLMIGFLLGYGANASRDSPGELLRAGIVVGFESADQKRIA